MRPERTLRIIGGQWRGRKFRFPPLDIRPTPDRVRETLFNWLQSRVQGARCLDLFAGSGALGLEALSRGASAVTFVEQQRTAAKAIEKLLFDWQAGGAQVICSEAQQYLAPGPPPQPFNLVFLDPPYGAAAVAECARRLDAGWLAADARIYVEHARRAALPELPHSWCELRSSHAGEVGYHLFGAGPSAQPGSDTRT
jgi:16S rRNA (guanine966-N2)-methyltransferase